MKSDFRLARAARDMDSNAHLKSTTLNSVNPVGVEHLKPVSVIVTRDPKAGFLQPNKSSNPFINFKIEIPNNGVRKRKIDDSSPDEGYETPAKKAFNSGEVLSPDLGCYMDFYTPPSGQEDFVSPLAFPKLALLDKPPRTEVEESESSLLPLKHVECGSSTQPVADNETMPQTLQCEDVLLNPPPPDFDCDVDDILDLNPFGTHPTEGLGPLDGDVEEEWNIGLPTFESSICHKIIVKCGASSTSEQVSQVAEEVQGGGGGSLVNGIKDCQSTINQAETTLDSSYEISLLPEVQLKSVVVNPRQNICSSNTRQNICSSKPVQARWARRLMVFGREEDWEHKKREYVHLVTRHMKKTPATENAMSELLNLMTRIADQKPCASGRQWQHPSDFTRRNYQSHLGKQMPKMSLRDWQTKNLLTHRRFACVPKIFERSTYP